MSAPLPAAPSRPILAPLLLFGALAGFTFAIPWWLGSPRALACALAGAAGAIPFAWLFGWGMKRPAVPALGIGILFMHLAAGVGGMTCGLPWVELLKFALQGGALGLAAELRWTRTVAFPVVVTAIAMPLILTILARHQVQLEESEGLRLQEVLTATIAVGRAFPDSGQLGPHAKVWVVDRGTARIVAAPDGRGGDLAETPLEHPGRMLTEAGGSYSTRLGRHAVVAWRAVPGQNDVGVAIIVYEPTSDFDEALGWELLMLVAVVAVGVIVMGGIPATKSVQG